MDSSSEIVISQEWDSNDCGDDCSNDCGDDCANDCGEDCANGCGYDCGDDCGDDCEDDCGDDCSMIAEFLLHNLATGIVLVKFGYRDITFLYKNRYLV